MDRTLEGPVYDACRIVKFYGTRVRGIGIHEFPPSPLFPDLPPFPPLAPLGPLWPLPLPLALPPFPLADGQSLA